jgi:hypothetical protein
VEHFDQGICEMSSGPPLIGRLNRDIAAELGFTGEEIDAMTPEGVLCAEPAAERLQ